MNRALDENNANKSYEQQSTQALDLHGTVLTDGVRRTYIPTLSHMFSVMPQYCKHLVTESSMSSSQEILTHE